MKSTKSAHYYRLDEIHLNKLKKGLTAKSDPNVKIGSKSLIKTDQPSLRLFIYLYLNIIIFLFDISSYSKGSLMISYNPSPD